MTTGVSNLGESKGRGLVGSLLPLVAVVAVALAAHYGIPAALGPYQAELAIEVGISIILAVSLTMVNGFTGQFSMGHAGFMALGGYASGAVMYYGSIKFMGATKLLGGALEVPNGQYLFPLAIVVGGLTAAGCGFLVGLPSLRLRGDYLAIVTLGFGEILRELLEETHKVIPPGAQAEPGQKGIPFPIGGSLGFQGLPSLTTLFWVYLMASLTFLVAYRLKFSTFGRAFLSIREDEVASESMGVNTTRTKVLAFVLSSFFAGVAGAMAAHKFGTVLTPGSFGFMKSFDVIIMVVLGGLGSISGATLAAVLVTLLPFWLQDLAEYKMVIFAFALVLMMILRPQGLLGIRELWEIGPFAKSVSRMGGGRS